MQVNTRHTSDQQLRDILHVIATHPETEPCVSLILRTAAQFTGAVGAAFLAWGGSAVTVGTNAVLPMTQDAAARLDGAVLHSASNTLIYPIRSADHLIGVMWLTVEAGYQFGDHERNLLAALADGLVIVTTRSHTSSSQPLAQALLTSIHDPLLVFDEKWNLMLLNPAAAAVFNLAPGENLSAVLRSDDLVAFVEGRRELNEWASGDKTFIPRVQAISDAQPFGWILALDDITQYKKLNHNQNEFVRIVSHDLRSPLTSMRGFADMLNMVGKLNERQEQFVEKVLSGIAQITVLVDNIQDAGRFDVETGFYEMTRSQCDLREMVTKIVSNYLIPAEKQELTLAVSVADDVPIINADANMLVRAITNLVDNAIKYTPNGGKIDVIINVQNKSVIITVRDNGLGISPEDQTQLFQRGGRVQRQEYKKVKGSGLGLFIVKSVALRHGGDAWVESAIGTGSQFSFSIPLKGGNLIIPGESSS